jgi:hypothetical protein
MACASFLAVSISCVKLEPKTIKKKKKDQQNENNCLFWSQMNVCLRTLLNMDENDTMSDTLGILLYFWNTGR